MIEQHKPLSTELIAKVNARAKLIRKKKKKMKKKREAERLTNKAEHDALMEKQNYLRQRRLGLDKNNQKKKSLVPLSSRSLLTMIYLNLMTKSHRKG